MEPKTGENVKTKQKPMCSQETLTEKTCDAVSAAPLRARTLTLSRVAYSDSGLLDTSWRVALLF